MKDLPFETNSTKQVVIFIGIQASGKTTFFKQELSCFGYTHINLDTLKTRNKESLAIRECLNTGNSFVVDNTNPEKSDRERYISLAKSHGYEVIGIFFQSILQDCIIRNTGRGSVVPTKAIPSTQRKLQLPEYSEGFDKLYFVRIVDNGFEITDWKE